MMIRESGPAIPAKEFAVFAVEDVAYVKPVTADGKARFAIHAANGALLGMADGREEAFAAVRLHDLTPLSVH